MRKILRYSLRSLGKENKFSFLSFNLKITSAIFFRAVLSVFFLGSYNLVAAQSNQSNSQEALNQLKAAGGASGANIAGSGPKDPRVIVAVIIRTALQLIGIVFVVLIVYAGFLWMTAGGEEEKASQAKKLIFNAVIGLAVILSSYAIAYFVFRSLLGATSGANPFGYGGYSNVTNYGPNPANYEYYTGTTGCCYKPDFSQCTRNIAQSDCVPPSWNNYLWQPTCP